MTHDRPFNLKRGQMLLAGITVLLSLVAWPAAGQGDGTVPQSPATPRSTADAPTGPDKPVGANVTDEQLRALAERLAGQRADAEAKSKAAAEQAAETDAAAASKAEGGVDGPARPMAAAKSEPADAGASEKDAAKADPAPKFQPRPMGQSPATTGGDTDTDGSYGGWGLNVVSSLAIVLLLIILLRGVLTKWMGLAVATRRTPVLEVISRITVAPRSNVLLIKLGSRILVVGESSAGLQTLAEIDDPEEIGVLLQAVSASKADSMSSSFSQMLGRFGKQHGDDGFGRSVDDEEVHVDRARDGVSGLRSRVRSMLGKGVTG